MAAGWGGQILLFGYLFAFGWCLPSSLGGQFLLHGYLAVSWEPLALLPVREKGVSFYLALYLLVTWCGVIFYRFSRFIFAGTIRVFHLGTIRVFHSGWGGAKFSVLGRHLVWGDLLPVFALHLHWHDSGLPYRHDSGLSLRVGRCEVQCAR